MSHILFFKQQKKRVYLISSYNQRIIRTGSEYMYSNCCPHFGFANI